MSTPPSNFPSNLMSEDQWNETQRVLMRYYRVKVPRVHVEAVMNKNKKLKIEIQKGSVGDTYAREWLMDELLKEIGMEPWPTYGENEEQVEKWKGAFERAAKSGGWHWGEDKTSDQSEAKVIKTPTERVDNARAELGLKMKRRDTL